jgi:hypothetical protein
MTDPNNIKEKFVFVACDGSTHNTKEEAILHGWESAVRNELMKNQKGFALDVYDFLDRNIPPEHAEAHYEAQVERVWRRCTEHFIRIIKRPGSKGFRDTLKNVIDAIEKTP